MVKKSDIVRKAVQDENWKKALQIAKDFHIGVTQEQRNKMARAYECIVHPDFYRQIGVDIPEAIEQGKAAVKEYAKSERRKNAIMKWDIKHDRAKRVIDAFLENADYWQEREDLVEGLTEEEKELVREEVALMIASIRKRYKLQERMNDQKPQIQQEASEMVNSMEKPKKTFPESVNEAEEQGKSKGNSSISTGEKKSTVRRPRAKKEVKQDEI